MHSIKQKSNEFFQYLPLSSVRQSQPVDERNGGVEEHIDDDFEVDGFPNRALPTPQQVDKGPRPGQLDVFVVIYRHFSGKGGNFGYKSDENWRNEKDYDPRNKRN